MINLRKKGKGKKKTEVKKLLLLSGYGFNLEGDISAEQNGQKHP